MCWGVIKDLLLFFFGLPDSIKAIAEKSEKARASANRRYGN